MKGRRYFIIITWFPYNELMENRKTVIDVEESHLEATLRILPLCEIAELKVVENNKQRN